MFLLWKDPDLTFVLHVWFSLKKKKKKSRSALITTLIRLSLQALQIAHCFGTWPLSDNCVWLNNTSPVVAKNDTTLLFTPKPLCFNHSWDSLKKKKKSIGLHLKTSKPFNTLENQASMHSFSKMLLSRDGGEHTRLPWRPEWVCERSNQRGERVDRQELNSHSGKREASALKQG